MSRYRLYPETEQVAGMEEHCGHARFVWNLAVEQQSWWTPHRGKAPNHLERCRQLTEARAAFDWLRDGSQTVQQQALRDFDQAMKNSFGGSHRRPTWRRRGQSEGFQIVGKMARVEKLNGKWSQVWVPKVGWVRFRVSRPVPDFASYRITKDTSGRWHAAFAAVPEPIPAPGTGEITGVDRGVAISAQRADGEPLHCPGLTPKETERLVRLQRRLAKAKRGSNHRARLKGQIAKLRAREKDRRKDWAEKTSTDLARQFDVIGVEDLKVRGMTKSARGTLVEPGTNVRQKAGLNREILRNGWGLLRSRLEDKAGLYDKKNNPAGRVVPVPAAYTSQRCSACGHVASESRESQAVFRCVACAFVCNADVNAARNIMNAAVQIRTADGHAVAARGGGPLGQPVNREPQRKTPPVLVGV